MRGKRGLSVSVSVRTAGRSFPPPPDLLEIRVRSLASALARAWLARQEPELKEMNQKNSVNGKKPSR
ncbi:protein of unknown function [Bradyrhizobium vignae]|uniref:Uncharacterized protein n=1 Tax=Bradyrhizobium vignae TaxID=1549949 RepID=A0A2U3PUM3_9BRAD|nr:protein of unknown function [Bradyrhizobium vignae]